MDKYFKIQKLVELQKDRKEKLESIFQDCLGFLPILETEFKLDTKRKSLVDVDMNEISFLVKVKVKDKSSVKFVVNQNKEKITEAYSVIFPNDILIIN
jgi:hypothetical protein